MPTHILGRLVGNTGDPTNLSMVLNSSFAGRRGEFVRVRHREQRAPRRRTCLRASSASAAAMSSITLAWGRP
jgi:hypothetical protein